MFQWPGPMFAASSFLPHSAPTWSIRWSFIIAMFIFYMSPIISLIWGLILTVVALREGFQKNVKLGLLAELMGGGGLGVGPGGFLGAQPVIR